MNAQFLSFFVIGPMRVPDHSAIGGPISLHRYSRLSISGLERLSAAQKTDYSKIILIVMVIIKIIIKY